MRLFARSTRSGSTSTNYATESPALVVSHDAGGAENLSAWVRQHLDPTRCAFLLEGPAIKIFERKLGPLGRTGEAEALRRMGEFRLLFAGSGWATDLETRAVRAAQAAGVRSIVYLDHWMRYPERFERGGESVYPDEVWAGDKYAFDLAARQLPQANVKLVPNPYFGDVVDAVNRYATKLDLPNGQERVLYATEPTTRVARVFTGDPAGYGYNEYGALSGYLKRMPDTAKFRLRPHPTESADKYGAVVRAQPRLIATQVGHERPLEEDIAWATTVVGCDSMVMALAVFAGRRVICAIPPGGRRLSLPFEEIEHLHPE